MIRGVGAALCGRPLREPTKELPYVTLDSCFHRNDDKIVQNMNNKGFTLIEIIILIVIAAILLPAIIVPFATGVKGSKKPEMVTTAMYLAHQRMEGLMKYDYQILNANSLTALTGWTGIDNNFPGYQQRWELVHLRNDFTIPVPDSNLGYIRIRIDVRDPDIVTYQVYSVVTDFP